MRVKMKLETKKELLSNIISICT